MSLGRMNRQMMRGQQGGPATGTVVPQGTGSCGRADNLPGPSAYQSVLSADWGVSGSPFTSLAGNQPGHHYGRQQE